MSKPYLKSGTIRTEGPSLRDFTDRKRYGGALLLLIITLLGFVTPASGQRKSDIGMMVAVPWYMGDLAPVVPQPLYSPPAIGPIYRHNFNKRNSLRGHAVFYQLAGSGEILGGTGAEFRSSFVDLGLDFEFNWWPYRTASQRTKYSPYVTAGLGYSLDLGGESKSHLYLPFGGGLKANLGKRLSGGVEVSMRTTFSDLLDGVANPGGEGVQTPVGNNDWYMFTGIFLTYKIFNYLNDCPTYQEKTYRINSNSRRNKSDNWFRMSNDHPLKMKGQGIKKPMGAKKNPGAAKGPTPAGHKKVKKKSGKKNE